MRFRLLSSSKDGSNQSRDREKIKRNKIRISKESSKSKPTFHLQAERYPRIWNFLKEYLSSVTQGKLGRNRTALTKSHRRAFSEERGRKKEFVGLGDQPKNERGKKKEKDRRLERGKTCSAWPGFVRDLLEDITNFSSLLYVSCYCAWI